MKYVKLVKLLEHAILDLLKSQTETIKSLMTMADLNSQFAVISVNLYMDEPPWLQLCLGNKHDKHRYLNTTADWSHFNLANTLETKSHAIDKAISAINDYYSLPEEAEYDEWEPEYKQYFSARMAVLLFATAQALLSPTVWRYYNSLQRDVYETAKKSLDECDETGHYIKNPLALNSLIEETSTSEPTLHCTVTQDDLTAEANYCELIKILRLADDSISELIDGIFQRAP